MGFLGFDAVLHAEAGAFDEDGFCMVEESVENGGGNGGVPVEDGRPLFEGLVGGQHDGAAFVASADDLEEEVGTALVDGQVTDFVEDEHGRRGVFAQLGLEVALGLGGVEGVDDIDWVGEEDADALLAGGVAQCGGKMGFAEADEAQEDDIGFVVDELETEEALDLEAVDFFGQSQRKESRVLMTGKRAA